MTRVGPNDPCPCGSGRKYKKCHLPRERLAARLGTGDGASVFGPGPVRPGSVAPAQPVPAHIVCPEYARNGRSAAKHQGTLIKDPGQVERMRAACRAARLVLDRTLALVAPGVTTEALDRFAHEATLALGGYPSPLNYCGFPKSICTSVNEVVCHGIPDDRPLAVGDIVNVDITVFLDGMHGDCSATVPVGIIGEADRRLLDATERALMAGVAAVRPGAQVWEIGNAIEEVVRPCGYGVVRDYVGHGLGEVFHMPPQVPHYCERSNNTVLQPGMTFTIEPMINQGDWRVRVWPDGWTAVTADGKRSAQFEHTVLVREDGVEVLTLPPGEPQPVPRRGGP